MASADASEPGERAVWKRPGRRVGVISGATVGVVPEADGRRIEPHGE